MGLPQNPSIWDEAVQTLDEEDKTRYQAFVAKGLGYQDVLQDILDATTAKKEESKKKRWKITIRGKPIIIRDVLEKLATRVQRFIAVGDAVVQFDPVHAALPWAAVSLILQVTVNDVEIFGAVLQAVVSISLILARCAVLESVYLNSTFQISERLRASLVNLYASILTFLGKALRYYSRNTAVRIAKSIVNSVEDVQLWLQPVSERQANVDRLVTVAEAERAQQSSDHLVSLKQGQLSQNHKLDENYLALQRLSDSLSEPVARIVEHITKIHDNLERESRVAIIKSISNINYNAQHKVASTGLLPLSGRWFLQKQQFSEWRDESCSSVLWLHGIPGSGKTKLTSMVISEIKNWTHAAYFYCVRNPAEPERSECDNILASLIRQLACPSPKSPVLAPVLSRYEDALDELVGFDEILWTREECIQVLIELRDLYPAIVFIVDALDEVNPMNRLELLDALLQVVDRSESLIKIFISSRENMDIDGAKENTEDIAKFVHRQLKAANILNGRLPSSLATRIPETLIEGAQGMFRWVDLQIQSLRTFKTAADIEARLGRLPATLEDSYYEIFEQIMESAENGRNLAIFTFQWLLYAQKPVAIADFALLATLLSTSSTIATTTYEVLDVCANLVQSNDEGIFRFTHLSVREFLEGLSLRQVDGRPITYFTPQEGNAAIAAACLSYLRHTLDTSNTSMAGQLSVTKQSRTNKALKAYAANYWPYHVSQSGHLKASPPLSANVYSFIMKASDAAPPFVQWCDIVAEMGSSALPDIQVAAALPPDPYWLVEAYDLLEKGRILIKDEQRQAKAFLHAASTGNCGVMTHLLDQGLDIKEVGIGAMRAARTAVQGDVVSLLLDLQVPADESWLIEAVLAGHSVVVIPLVSKGAHNFSPTLLKRAYTMAAANADDESVAAFRDNNIEKDDVAVVRALKAQTSSSALNLINAGFDIRNPWLPEQRTPLHWASYHGFLSVTERLLLDGGVRVTMQDTWGYTPLHLAALQGRTPIVRVLLYGSRSSEIDRAAVDDDGRSPLHLAASMGRVDVVRLLLEAGFENVPDKDGVSAETHASRHRHSTVAKVLSLHNPSTVGFTKQDPIEEQQPVLYAGGSTLDMYEWRDVPEQATGGALYTEVPIATFNEADEIIQVSSLLVDNLDNNVDATGTLPPSPGESNYEWVTKKAAQDPVEADAGKGKVVWGDHTTRLYEVPTPDDFEYSKVDVEEDDDEVSAVVQKKDVFGEDENEPLYTEIRISGL